jgi:hypothetical protein
MMLQNLQNEMSLPSNDQENLEELQIFHSRKMTMDATTLKEVSSKIQVILPRKN